MLEHKRVKKPFIEIDSKLYKKLDQVSELFRFFPSPSATRDHDHVREFSSAPIAGHSITSTKANPLSENDRYWCDKIKAEFKQVITVKPHQHSPRKIYYHFQQRSLKIKPNCDYHLNFLDKIAILHSSLSDKQLKIHDLSFCLTAAAQVGNIDLVQWLMSKDRGEKQVLPNKSLLERTLRNAVSSGNLTLVQWLASSEEGALCLHKDWLGLAARSGNMELLQWLYPFQIDQHEPWQYMYILGEAARSGNLTLLQWLMSSERGSYQMQIIPDRELYSDLLPEAVASGNLDVIEWLMSPERGAEQLFLSEETIFSAARSGNLQLLQKLILLKPSPYTRNPVYHFFDGSDADLTETSFKLTLLSNAASSGNLSIVKWMISEVSNNNLQSMQSNFREKTPLDVAASNGHLHIVQYLMSVERGDKQINPTGETLDAAMWSGNRKLLEWLTAAERSSQRLVLSEESLCTGLRYGSSAGNFTVLEWLMTQWVITQEKILSSDHWSMMHYYFDRKHGNDLSFVHWLISPDLGVHQLNPNVLLPAMARKGGVEFVKQLILVKATPNQNTVCSAALSGNVELVRWLTAAERGYNQVIPRQATIDFVKSLEKPGLATLWQEMEKQLHSRARRKTVLSGLNSEFGAESFLTTVSHRSSFDPQVLRTVFNFSGDPLPSLSQRAQCETAPDSKAVILSFSTKQSETDLPEPQDAVNFTSKPWF